MLYRFGAFELDAKTGELRKSGVRIKLGGQPLEVLTLLVQRQGELVTREELKDALWKEETFTDFDHGVNTSIQRIRRALGDSAQNPRFVETLPRKGYRFVAPVDGYPTVQQSRSWQVPWAKAAAALGAILVAVVGLSLWNAREPESLEFSESVLTYGQGAERNPSFSPDGTRFAYDKRNEEGNRDIYVRLIEPGAQQAVRVTSDQRDERQPAWSPDGTKVAFARILESRVSPGESRFELVVASPAENGDQRRIGEYRTRGVHITPSWSSDGQYIAFGCRLDVATTRRQICICDVESGDTWPLTNPISNSGSSSPLLSPDGTMLAFVDQGVRIQELTEEMQPRGESVRVASELFSHRPAGWSADSKHLYVLGQHENGASGLWSVGLASGSNARLVRAGPTISPDDGGSRPALFLDGDRVLFVYEELVRNSSLFLLDLLAPEPRSPVQLTSSDGLDYAPDFSQDGKRIAFLSNRTGMDALWIYDLDKKSERPIAEFPFAEYSSPKWASDGERILMDAVFRTGSRDVYIVDVASQRVGPNLTGVDVTGSDGRAPIWSNDGKSVYYTKGRERGVWQLDLDSGVPKPLIEGVGSGRPQLSKDGRHLYVPDGLTILRLRLSPDGQIEGEPEEIAAFSMPNSLFALAEEGLYVLRREGGIVFVDPETGVMTEVIATAAPQGVGGLSVSRDGRWLVYTEWEPKTANLKLLESVE